MDARCHWPCYDSHYQDHKCGMVLPRRCHKGMAGHPRLLSSDIFICLHSRCVQLKRASAPTTSDAKPVDPAYEKVLAERAQYEVTSRPTVLEYFGYAFFFPGLLAGPAYEFRDYKEFIEGSWFNRGQSKPSPLMPLLLKLVEVVLSAVLTLNAWRFVFTKAAEQEWLDTHHWLYKCAAVIALLVSLFRASAESRRVMFGGVVC